MDAQEAERLNRVRALELALEHYDAEDEDDIIETAAKFYQFLQTGKAPAKDAGTAG